MSFASSRVFRACRTLLAPAKSTGTASTVRTTAAAAVEAVKPKPKAKAKSSASPKSPRKVTRPSGIVKVTPVSPEMARFLGTNEASRTDTVKKIWLYIKSHNLQNPANKREILCDEKLKSLFDGKDKVGFLEISKLLSRHFTKTT